MSRAEKITKARELRAQGLTYREIGERLGIPLSTARDYAVRMAQFVKRDCKVCGRAFTPENGHEKYCSQKCVAAGGSARRRRCAETVGRAKCSECGDPLCAGSKWLGVRRCRACRRIYEAERVDYRAHQIEQWWREGLQMPEIASRLGCSMNHLSVDMVKLREKGYDLPYRYKTGSRSGRKFPEQVAT